MRMKKGGWLHDIAKAVCGLISRIRRLLRLNDGSLQQGSKPRADVSEQRTHDPTLIDENDRSPAPVGEDETQEAAEAVASRSDALDASGPPEPVENTIVVPAHTSPADGQPHKSGDNEEIGETGALAVTSPQIDPFRDSSDDSHNLVELQEESSTEDDEVSPYLPETHEQNDDEGVVESPPEPVDEFSTPGIDELSPLPNQYQAWNKAIAEHILLTRARGENVYLSVTPRILSAALSEAGAAKTPEEAEAEFADAVADAYRDRVLAHSEKLRLLRRFGVDGVPECIAFLALTVLAAYRMRADEEAASHAYYFRLAELLQCDLVGPHPQGFNTDVFKSLWLFVESWLESSGGGRLVLPSKDAGFHRFVAIPLAHVPLRQLDIEKLPEFFAWAGYSPRSRVYAARLESDLLSWGRAPSVLTLAGKSALDDERLPAILAQVANELEAWDGTVEEKEPTGRKSKCAPVEVTLDLGQWRRAELNYLPRRPAGYPAHFDDGTHVLGAADEGWYDQVPLGPENGQELVEGFTWKSTNVESRIILRRTGACVIAMVPSQEYTGFMSHRSLLKGVRCAVLCHESLISAATKYLTEVTQQQCTPLNDSSLPSGWQLFTNITPKLSLSAPQELAGIDVDSNINLIPSGGLRIRGRWSWIAGAPPRLSLAGFEEGQQVTVDNKAVDVKEYGKLLCNDLLDGVGTHIVEAEGYRKSIEIVQPQIKQHFPQAGSSIELGQTSVSVGLPVGSWTLIGSRAGTVAQARCKHVGGSVARCGFDPVWAIQVGGGPGAIVLALSSLPASPTVHNLTTARGAAKDKLTRWVSPIYNANVRRPHIMSRFADTSDDSLHDAWKRYAQLAKQIKRALRRHY